MPKCGDCMYFIYEEHRGLIFEEYFCSHFARYVRERQESCRFFVENKRGCYLTTACVKYKGLPDDCEELTVLRNFIDEHLSKTEKGKKMISEYYDIAPTIVESIDKNENRAEIYDFIYSKVLECVDSIKKGNFEEAVLYYEYMVLSVKNKCIEE